MAWGFTIFVPALIAVSIVDSGVNTGGNKMIVLALLASSFFALRAWAKSGDKH
jgi:hypothetical protein